MERASGARCMRSQVAPEWTIKEALILVNEIAAVEADCLKALSTHQKWRIISENCTALEVPRTLNQCRRKWDSLLDEYKTITRSRRAVHHSTESESLPAGFDHDLFNAIDNIVRAKDNQYDTDPDSDPEANADRFDVIAKLGSKKRRPRSVPVKAQKKSVQEKRMKTRSEEKLCESHVGKGQQEQEPEMMSQNRCKNKKTLKGQSEGNNRSGIKEEERVTVKLQEKAELVHAIVTEKVDYGAGKLSNVQDLQSDFIRQQGDKLIACLGEMLDALNQLSDSVGVSCE